MPKINYPSEFIEYLFHQIADGTNYNTNYGRTDSWHEYGITEQEFLDQYWTEAQEDVYNYLETRSEDQINELIVEFQKDCKSRAQSAAQAIKEIEKFKKKEIR